MLFGSTWPHESCGGPYPNFFRLACRKPPAFEYSTHSPSHRQYTTCRRRFSVRHKQGSVPPIEPSYILTTQPKAFLGPHPCTRQLRLRLLRLGFLQDRNVAVGVFPQREDPDRRPASLVCRPAGHRRILSLDGNGRDETMAGGRGCALEWPSAGRTSGCRGPGSGSQR